jgi:hypothetical protein
MKREEELVFKLDEERSTTVRILAYNHELL